MDKGLGTVTWWGFSPAIDIAEYFTMTGFSGHHAAINVLIVGSGDIRHVLKTVSMARIQQAKTGSKAIHFYVLENNLELYARAILMISLALEHPDHLGLQEKAELMAEIFGNSLVRTQTAEYIQQSSNEFVKLVTDFDLLNERLPVFDLTGLKYKERDMLEGIFKLWRKPDTNIFDIEQCWDLRVRQYLGTRYDTAKGAFDWDYSMKLCDRGAEIIGSRAYQHWRKSGTAFQLREGSYDVPNKTLASGMIFNVQGERHGRRGYWGDIVVSPYIAFGVECADDSFFKKANKEYICDSQQITQHNLTHLLHGIVAGEHYVAHKDGVSTDTTEPPMATLVEEDEQHDPNEEGDAPKQPKEPHQYMPCDGLRISFLPLNSLPEMSKKQKYGKLFDVAYFSNSMVHHLTPAISDVFADQALVILETAKFITELSREQYIQFTNKIDSMAKAVSCSSLFDCNPEKDSFAFYTYQRDIS